MANNILYIKNSQNKIRFWKIYYKKYKNTYYIYSDYGTLNEKPIQYISDTTESLDNVKKIIKKKIGNKLKKGYSHNINNLKSINKIISPMGAQLLQDNYGKLHYPVCCQEKLDGFRCLANKQKTDTILYSKTANIFHNLKHINDELEKLLLDTNIYLDGELYSHKYTFNKISSLLRKKTLLNNDKKDIININFYVFDMFDINNEDLSYKNRYDFLKKKFSKINSLKYIKLVNCKQAKNKNEIINYYNKFLNNGYEGIIVRNYNGLYKYGKKSYDVLRTKEFKKDYFKVIDYKLSKDNITPIWKVECNNKTNKFFYAAQMGSKKNKSIILSNIDKYINKMILIKYNEIDENGCVIRNPIAI